MQRNSILVHSVRMPASLELQDALGAGDDEVICLGYDELACNVIEARAIDLVAVDADGRVPGSVLEAARAAGVPVVSVSGCPEVASHLLRERAMANLLICPGGRHQCLDIDIDDLTATKHKLIRKEGFGLRHYVDGEPIRYRLEDCSQSHYMAMCLRDDLYERGHGRQQVARIALLVHQLATAALERQDDASVPVEIEVCADNRTLGASIRFGGLGSDELDGLVRRCLDEDIGRPTTADLLGLPSLLTWCRTVVINAEPGRATEVIGLLQLDSAEAWQGSASLHLSVTGPLPGWSCDGSPNETVRLSDSMRNQLIDSAARGGDGGAVAVEIADETCMPIPTPHARTRRGRPLDLLGVLHAIAGAATPSNALKTALAYLEERFLGAVLLEVGESAVNVWAAVGVAADRSGLLQYIVQLDEASTLGFLAREAALMHGRPGDSSADRLLAKLVTGHEHADCVSLSIAVSGRIRFILHGYEPVMQREQVERELQAVGAQLSRTLQRFDLADEREHESGRLAQPTPDCL